MGMIIRKNRDKKWDFLVRLEIDFKKRKEVNEKR